MTSDLDSILATHPEGWLLRVRVRPRSSRQAVEAIREGALGIRVMAPPVDQAATEACREVLAEACGVPRSAVILVAGQKSREKRFLVRGDRERILQHLLASLEAAPPTV